MAPELLAGKLNILVKRIEGAISEDEKGYLEKAASYLIAAQDLRDSVDEKFAKKDLYISHLKLAANEFDSVVS